MSLDGKEITMSNRVAFFYPSGHINVSPSVRSALIYLAQSNCAVDFYTIRNARVPETPIVHPLLRTHYFPVTMWAAQEPRWLLTICFALWVLLVCRERYQCIVAAGIRGLLAAYLVGQVRRLSVIYLCLELYIGPKLNTRLGKAVKWLERTCIRAAEFSIIQDEVRASMLMKDAGITRDRIELVPNSPLGKGRIKRSDFLHQRLGLDPKVNLLLSAGTVGPAFMTQEIVLAAQSLPEGWLCVIHSANPLSQTDPYVRSIQKANIYGKAVFSWRPVPFDQLEDLIGSARIGIALYGQVGGSNTTNVGLASGKLAQYLKSGVPVIVSDYPSLRDIIAQYNCGVAISSPDQLPSAVSIITENYDVFCRNAVRCFDELFSFEVAFDKVVTRIKTLGRG